MRDSLGPQILELHRLWQAHGTDRLTSANTCLQTAQIFRAEYVGALLGREEPTWADAVIWLHVPPQTQVDRDLAVYERYVQ